MRNVARPSLTSILTTVAFLVLGQDAESQEPGGALSLSAGYAANVDELRGWDAEIDGLVRTGDLVEMSLIEDERLPGREHQYVAQFFQGVPVFGGGVSRQLDGGVTVSLFGTLHQGLGIDTAPGLSAAEAGTRIEAQTGATLEYGPPPELGILPLPDRSYALAYRAEMSDHRVYFADAADGSIIHAVDAFDTQSAIGAGTGFLGDRKKLATTSAGGRFEARDQLRPGEIVTLDMRFDEERLDSLVERGEYGVARWTANDIAVDTDNEWDDPAVVDLQAHMGWTYDYFAQRHGWNGVDGRDGRVLGLVNNDFNNARYYAPWRGPEGTGALVFGVRRDRESGVEEPRVALHTVAHEAMHGVTYHAVGRRVGGDRWGIWTNPQIGFRLGPRSITREGHEHTWEKTTFQIRVQDEWTPVPAWCVAGRFLLGSYQGTAVNEAYSDIFGVSVGFFHEEAGAAGTYEYGGEYAAGTVRSLSDPGSELDAASYDSRWEFALARDDRRFYFSGALFRGGQPWNWHDDYCCYGAQHWNSTVLSHAFYLAIEGGTNRETGLSVEGVGGANREKIEDIFFRSLKELMPQATSLPQAADAIRQAAADLATGQPAQRSVEEALRAVGLPPERRY
ncbi:MAG: M4 family metallopeptidase [Acidobacteria bacterium]|nr:M4 family metallopeptidase [Acidobacteriota bacterium]